MKKKDTDLQDIYGSKEPGKGPEQSWKVQELVEQELRKRFAFNLFIGVLAVALTVFLLLAIAKEFIAPPPEKVPVSTKPARQAAYTLPPDEQWALEYRQSAQAENSGPPGAKKLSTKWVKNAGYHIIMGEQALRMKDMAAAQSHLATVLEMFPEAAGIHHGLGQAYLSQKQFEPAIKQLQQALEESPSTDALNNLGVAYIGTENYTQAESFLKRALQQQPDLAGCHKNLALLYQQTGRTNEAVASYEKYFSLNPMDAGLILHFATYLADAGRSRDAINFLSKIEGGSPVSVSLLLAKAAAQEKDAELAVRALRNAAQSITPRQTLAEMHNEAFGKIAGTEPFEALLRQLELAVVTHSTNLNSNVKLNH
jgi:tetratricopeptide (TPR) repeat protein